MTTANLTIEKKDGYERHEARNERIANEIASFLRRIAPGADTEILLLAAVKSIPEKPGIDVDDMACIRSIAAQASEYITKSAYYSDAVFAEDFAAGVSDSADNLHHFADCAAEEARERDAA